MILPRNLFFCYSLLFDHDRFPPIAGWEGQKHLGSGSYGKVYLYANQEGQKIAVKFMNNGEEAVRNSSLLNVDSFEMNELKSIMNLKHEYIIKILSGEAFPKTCLPMEYCEGGNLRAKIREGQRVSISVGEH